uniref:G protein-coupled receptor class C group 5 member C n=2 Tax=Coturnix japonica TaxID=93934 RepID=A0A8C2UIK9_COTJA
MRPEVLVCMVRHETRGGSVPGATRGKWSGRSKKGNELACKAMLARSPKCLQALALLPAPDPCLVPPVGTVLHPDKEVTGDSHLPAHIWSRFGLWWGGLTGCWSLATEMLRHLQTAQAAPAPAPQLCNTSLLRRVLGAPLSTHLPCRMGAAVPAAACILLALLPTGRAQSTPPSGCGQDLSSLYYNLCDLSAAWGIVLEAAASLGAVTSFVLTIVLVASLPFVQDPQKKSLVATQAFFLLGTFGLFCLTFDFIVGPDFSTCTSRRFLFGVLFAICFSCLLAHAVALNFLARRNRGPRGWVTLAVALLLAMVEVIINAEWLIITVARQEGGPADPCGLADADFVMALIYVMVLLVAAFGTAWPALCGRYTRWRKHSIFILATTGLSMAIWVTWMAMYLYGNQHVGKKPGWDDPTLAIALVSNAYTFILLYIIPEVTHITRRSSEQGYEDDVYPTRGVGYETILKEQKSQSMFVENKAFSMDEPSFAKKPVSPYSGYNGQLLTSVYQPTEMALMHKGTSEGPYDVILPRATAASSASSTLRAEDAFAVQARHAAAQRDARSSQVLSPYSRNRW